MDDTYLNVKNFLSQNTMLVPGSTGEFLKLYHMAAPEMVYRVEKLLNPLFQDYTVSFSEQSARLRQYTYSFDKDSDSRVTGVFVFQFRDMHIAFPDRFFITIEDMIEADKFKIDHGKVYYSFREGNTSDIESFISFKELGYKNINDYNTAVKENTGSRFREIKGLVETLPANIRERFFYNNQSYPNDKILKEAGLFYYKTANNAQSYDEVIESFRLGYDDFDTYRKSKRFGSLSFDEFAEFKKHADGFNTYEAYLKAKNSSIFTESGILLFDKLTALKERSGYSNLVEALIHYILENYIFEKMSREAFTNKIRSLISDILIKYGMNENNELKDFNSLLDPSIAELESRKELFEYNQSTGVIRIIK